MQVKKNKAKAQKIIHPIPLFKDWKNWNPNFNPNQRTLFSLLLLKADYWNKPFYHSYRQLQDESGIKKDGIKSVLSYFSKLGFYSSTKTGKSNTTHHHIDFQKLNDAELLSIIYRPSFVPKVKPWFVNKSLDVSGEHSVNRRLLQAGLSEDDIESVFTILDDMNECLESYDLSSIDFTAKQYMKVYDFCNWYSAKYGHQESNDFITEPFDDYLMAVSEYQHFPKFPFDHFLTSKKGAYPIFENYHFSDGLEEIRKADNIAF